MRSLEPLSLVFIYLISFSVSLSLFLSISLYPSLSLTVSLPFFLPLSPVLSVALSLSFSFSLSLSLSVSLSFSLYLSLLVLYDSPTTFLPMYLDKCCSSFSLYYSWNNPPKIMLILFPLTFLDLIRVYFFLFYFLILVLILFIHIFTYSYFLIHVYFNCISRVIFYFSGVYISNEAYDYASSSVYYAFHFAHMVILFIGLAFILQAILLITLIATRKVNIMNQYLQVILFVFLFCLLCSYCQQIELNTALLCFDTDT